MKTNALIRASLAQNPDTPAYMFNGESISREELAALLEPDQQYDPCEHVLPCLSTIDPSVAKTSLRLVVAEQRLNDREFAIVRIKNLSHGDDGRASSVGDDTIEASDFFPSRSPRTDSANGGASGDTFYYIHGNSSYLCVTE